MPRAIGRLLGIAPPPVKAPPPDFEHARAFADVVQPILQERCISCHGTAKNNGGLRLDSWEMLAKGGKHGAVVKAGDLAASPLIRRVDLPVEEKEHMPPRGKPQLADDDLTVLEWWVGASVPRDALIASLDLPPSVEAILDTRLGGGSLGAPPERAATLALATPIADRLGIIIRPMSPDGPWLDVNARGAGRAFGDAELAQLAPIAPAIEWLDLGGTSVTDAGLPALDPMRRLQRLHLDQLGVTDGGLAALGHLKQLGYLNLRGTAVTDKGLPALRSLPRLRALYVWQTAVTPEAVKALGDALVDKRRLARWKEDEADLERRIQEDHFEGNTGESLRPPDGAPPSPDPKPPTHKT
jgi:mono/diheme cytochrome c family protein